MCLVITYVLHSASHDNTRRQGMPMSSGSIVPSCQSRVIAVLNKKRESHRRISCPPQKVIPIAESPSYHRKSSQKVLPIAESYSHRRKSCPSQKVIPITENHRRKLSPSQKVIAESHYRKSCPSQKVLPVAESHRRKSCPSQKVLTITESPDHRKKFRLRRKLSLTIICIA